MASSEIAVECSPRNICSSFTKMFDSGTFRHHTSASHQKILTHIHTQTSKTLTHIHAHYAIATSISINRIPSFASPRRMCEGLHGGENFVAEAARRHPEKRQARPFQRATPFSLPLQRTRTRSRVTCCQACWRRHPRGTRVGRTHQHHSRRSRDPTR